MLCPYLSGFLVALRGLLTAMGGSGGVSNISCGGVSCVISVSGLTHGMGSWGWVFGSLNGWLFRLGNSWMSFSIEGVAISGGGPEQQEETTHPTIGL